MLVALGANVPPLVWEGQWWRLLACMFLHIGVAHLLLNGWALYQLGTLFESLAGLGADGGGLLRQRARRSGGEPVLHERRPLRWRLRRGVRAAGALVAFLLRHRERLLPSGKQLLYSLLLWAGVNVVLGMTNPGIDNAGHAGGASHRLRAGIPAAEPARDPAIR